MCAPGRKPKAYIDRQHFQARVERLPGARSIGPDPDAQPQFLAADQALIDLQLRGVQAVLDRLGGAQAWSGQPGCPSTLSGQNVNSRSYTPLSGEPEPGSVKRP